MGVDGGRRQCGVGGWGEGRWSLFQEEARWSLSEGEGRLSLSKGASMVVFEKTRKRGERVPEDGRQWDRCSMEKRFVSTMLFSMEKIFLVWRNEHFEDKVLTTR